MHARAGEHAEALAVIDGFLTPFSKQSVSVEAVQSAAVAVRLCNELALGCMRDAASPEQLDSAYAYLKWALKAPHASPALRAVTLNNAGIYYARTGQPQAALRCLERVGRQGGVVVEDDVSVHVTLNMTTVLADLGRHGEALERAQEAVRTLTHDQRAGKQTDASLLSAAYHNLAVQQERLGSSKGHVRSYRAAVQQARKSGNRTPMANFMSQAYTHARQRAAQPAPEATGGAPAGLPPVRGGSGGPTSRRRGAATASRGAAAHTPAARAHTSHERRRAGGGAAPTGGGAGGAPADGGGGPFVSLDDVYSGAVPAATVPIGATSGITPAMVPFPGRPLTQTSPQHSPSGPRHAPRSAGSARIGPSR